MIRVRYRSPRLIAPLILGLLLLPRPSRASEQGDAAAAAEEYRSRIGPLLETYCYSCHGDETQSADLNLQSYAEVASIASDRDRWELIRSFIEDGDMPPAGVEPRPSGAEVDELSGWIAATLSQIDCNLVEPGNVTLRRLNRAEYDYTVRDLLGVDFQPAEEFPADDVGYGFDNIGDVLTLDPLLLEKYLEAAEEITRRAIDIAGPGPGKTVGYDGRLIRDKGGRPHGDDDQILASEGELGIDHAFETDGRYVLRARVYGDQAGDEPVRMAIRVDGRTLREFEVEATRRSRMTYEVPVALKAGTRRVAVAFLNDYYDEDAGERPADRNLIVNRLEVQGPTDPVVSKEVESLDDDAGGQLYGGKGRLLATAGEISFRHDFEAEGEYRIRVVAFAQQAGPDPARLGVKFDGETVDVLDVPSSEAEPGTFEARVRVKRGKRAVALSFLNDYYNQDHPDEALRGDRNLVLDRVEFVGPVESYYHALPESHRRVIAGPALSGSYEEVAHASLRRLANRAYRRPSTPEEVEGLMGLFRMVRRDGASFEEAMRVAVQAILVSPNFLFRVEYGSAPDPGLPGDVRPLTDWELASRLSYFLWSSMPDEELFRAAFEGRLQDPGELARQARRMLQDPRASRFIERFAGQWLQIQNLDAVAPDPDRFPEFDDELRRAMRRETELFFGAIVREDRSVLDLLDADYTFLNDRLATHYGIPGVEGPEFRRVDLPGDARRGGVLTQASILTITSNPTRTSPVKRGKYILDQILGSPIPPPPPDVPELEEGPELAGTLRQRMEQHSTNPSCASCHRRMDPLGFGLENFDAVGRWRDSDGEAPIDASGTLPGGDSFAGPGDLVALLKARADDFARTLAENLMTYALGRGLEYYDRCAVDRILADLDGHDSRFGRLVADIVTSDAFRMRKVEGGN
ncbi:DUF1592 domain-containing protein [Tautonia plasticadhaerens]|uniref:Cytochrome c domain-containing protein n=1 Tax=Tautonia plasticadhaerens TaxID=2527974 RepID=A0A518HAU6_9BACT|nr:DUF1592 domain-containing protein [Tautonia plasticadhaerens]QDV37978.1 hypothetical protein ElP_59250 [Tautonia plasticadhaerens]